MGGHSLRFMSGIVVMSSKDSFDRAECYESLEPNHNCDCDIYFANLKFVSLPVSIGFLVGSYRTYTIGVKWKLMQPNLI